jgi:hypothetical protein
MPWWLSWTIALIEALCPGVRQVPRFILQQAPELFVFMTLAWHGNPRSREARFLANKASTSFFKK